VNESAPNVPKPRLIAWEITRSCNLRCVHCRAAAQAGRHPDELSTFEALALIDDIADYCKPILILTGGEPLLRPDVFEIAHHADTAGLRVVMATNGTLLTSDYAQRAVKAGIQRISVSLDGASPASHDSFRQEPGAFDGALRGIEAAKAVELPFQINMSVVRANRAELPAVLKLSSDLGAVAFHVFLLVPTGRGRDLDEMSAQEYEDTLHWIHHQRKASDFEIQVTCAPHYARIERENPLPGARPSAGCMGGQTFCFISHTGVLSPCGYLEINCGNVRDEGFVEAWEQSTVFMQLRDRSKYTGKCGRCEFVRICGGCRARAYAATGNHLAEEPLCVYQPRQRREQGV
jgi:heme b synthase